MAATQLPPPVEGKQTPPAPVQGPAVRSALDGGRKWSDVAACDGADAEPDGTPPAGADARGRRPSDDRRSMTQGGRTRRADHSGCDRGHTRRVAPLGEGA